MAIDVLQLPQGVFLPLYLVCCWFIGTHEKRLSGSAARRVKPSAFRLDQPEEARLVCQTWPVSVLQNVGCWIHSTWNDTRRVSWCAKLGVCVCVSFFGRPPPLVLVGFVGKPPGSQPWSPNPETTPYMNAQLPSGCESKARGLQRRGFIPTFTRQAAAHIVTRSLQQSVQRNPVEKAEKKGNHKGAVL